MKKNISILLSVIFFLLLFSPAVSFADTKELHVLAVYISDKVYDGTPYPTRVSITTRPSLSWAGDVGVTFKSVFEDANVGKDKKITISEMSLIGSDADKYQLVWDAPTEYSATIYYRGISVYSCFADSKTYDGNRITKPVFILYNVLDEDEEKITVKGNALFEDADVGTDKKVYVTNLYLDGDKEVLRNYQLLSYEASATADILPKEISVSGFSVENKEYDGDSAATVIPQYTGVLSNEDIIVTAEGDFYNDTWNAPDANAGKKNVLIRDVELSGTDKISNYTLTVNTELKGQAVINPKAVSVRGIKALDKVEDGTTDVILDCSEAVVEGLIADDTVGIKATGYFENGTPGIQKKVIINNISLTGSKASNYKLSSSGQQKETKATIIANPQKKPDQSDELPSADKVEAYVTRCYQIILCRAPDAGGLNNWVNELNSGRKAAAEIIEQFVASAEFQNKNLSNADAVEILYKAMLGRGSDQAGKADWVAKLDAGQHLTAVINGFSGSAEFKAICDSYGINPGTVAVQENPGAANEKIKAYVERCYQIILGRGADEGGLNTWMDELTSGRKAAAEIIEQFVASAEFQNKKLSNNDSVEILYKAMLGRGSDPAGKASWVEKLDAGQDLTAVINGFCGSAEFKAICDSYGIQPGTVTVKQPTTPVANDEKIRAFVARCYKIILGRDADEDGMNTWAGELKSGRKAAAEIIESFVSSAEFKGKYYSNPDAVEIMYKAMLGRGSDAAGKADWVGKLNAGQPLTAVINGFCGSAEFKAICDAYGITPGTVNVENVSKAAEETAKSVEQKTEKKANLVEITNASDTVNENLGTAVQAIYINEEKAKEFIGRCYRVILGREASQAELDSWIGQMMNSSKTADQIARGFLFSGEFKGRNIGNEELVKILYRVYMNREADPEGLATWTQKLDEGTGLNDLLNVFAKTSEFKAVVRDMAE